MVEIHDRLSVFSILIGGWLLRRSDKASLRLFDPRSLRISLG